MPFPRVPRPPRCGEENGKPRNEFGGAGIFRKLIAASGYAPRVSEESRKSCWSKLYSFPFETSGLPALRCFQRRKRQRTRSAQLRLAHKRRAWSYKRTVYPSEIIRTSSGRYPEHENPDSKAHTTKIREGITMIREKIIVFFGAVRPGTQPDG